MVAIENPVVRAKNTAEHGEEPVSRTRFERTSLGLELSSRKKFRRGFVL